MNRPRLVVCLLAGVVATGCGARSDVASGNTSVKVEVDEPFVPVEDVCNGIDDDLDGFVDEDPVTTECGAGACRAKGACVDGAIRCDPKPPAAEICNGVDDDCDGSVDEDQGFVSLGPPAVLWTAPGGSVFGADLVKVGDSLLVAFQNRIGDPPLGPNQRTLRVGLDGTPRGSVVDLPTRVSFWGPRVSLGPDDRIAIASCGLDGHDYFAYSALVDGATGKLMGSRDVRRSPTDRSCGADTPDGFFVGNHYLYGWVENSSNADGNQVIFDVADASLESVKTTVLTDEGDLAVPPRFAVHGDRLAVGYGLRGYPRDSVLRVHVFRNALAALPDPLELPAPEGQDWGETQVLPSETGFILLGDNRFDAGLFRAAVDLDGAIAEPMTAIENAGEEYAEVHSTSRPGGGFALVAAVADKDRRTTVMALDATGHVASTVEERWVALPRAALGLDDGRVAVLFTEETGKDENELAIEFYGCAPDVHQR